MDSKKIHEVLITDYVVLEAVRVKVALVVRVSVLRNANVSSGSDHCGPLLLAPLVSPRNPLPILLHPGPAVVQFRAASLSSFWSAVSAPQRADSWAAR